MQNKTKDRRSLHFSAKNKVSIHKRRFRLLRIITDVSIITVVEYRFEPEVSHLQSLKVGVRNKFQLLLGTVVEWYELHCKQFAHTYSTLWGKENETP